ncbi:ApbE family protein [uncultured Eubacteriales bacterium]|uniref:FAD:protein FMN transferase n=1 Tax=uncultured Eubacteriales bacterium TaxID=172733 RepID=A0A212J9Y5_9FIRM|nr:ApbE family protein [uncultured Eubacteriales bacterium]
MKRRLFPLLAALLLLTGCAPKEPVLHNYEASFLNLFDTVTVITGYAESEEGFRAIATEVRDDLLYYHQLFDIYNEYEGVRNLKTINDSAGGDAVEVEKPIIDLLLFCREMYDVSGGQVNAAMGSVLTLWHDAREAGIDDPEHAALPDADALSEAGEHMDFDSVVIDEANSTVRITDPQVRLDVGAIAKGYAVERVCENAPAGLLVSVGGNVRATGGKPDGSPWAVGIRDPEDSGAYLRTVLVSNMSVVTSGDYERYYTVDGVRYHHLIDPETLYPANYWKMVTILCPDSGVADGLSTALFCTTQEEGQALLDKYAAEAMWVTPEGEVLYSPGFADYLKT